MCSFTLDSVWLLLNTDRLPVRPANGSVMLTRRSGGAFIRGSAFYGPLKYFLIQCDIFCKTPKRGGPGRYPKCQWIVRRVVSLIRPQP